MGTEAITPALETPVAAPAAVETTPAAPVTPAAPAEVQSVAAEAPSFTNAQDRADYLREKLAKAAEAPAEVKPAEAAAPPEIKPPAAEVVKTPEEVAAEQKTAEEKAEAEKQAAATADPLDKLGALPAEKIAAAIKSDPELAAKLEALGLPGAQLIENAREAAQAGQFKELFPTLEIAQVAKQGSENFNILDTKFPAIKDAETYNDFMMNTLVPMSYIVDDKGDPIPDPNVPGTFKTDGSVARFIKMSNDVEFNQLGKISDLLAANGSDEQKEYAQNLKAAVDYIKDFRDNGYKIPGTPSGEKPTALPPEVQARLDEADKIKRETADRSAADAKEKSDAFENKISDKTVEVMSPLIKDILDKTSLTEFEKETIADRVWKDLADTLASNGDWKRTADQMMSRRELNDAVQQRRVGHNVNSMKALYIGIIDKYLAKTGATRVAKNEDLQKKIATQKETARMEPKTGAVAAPGAPAAMTGDQRFEKAKEIARAENNGEEPSNSQITRALLKLPQSA